MTNDKPSSRTDASAEEKSGREQKPPEVTFPIVGIGASAGGLEALTELLSNLPINPGMAFLIVQHLHPGHADSGAN